MEGRASTLLIAGGAAATAAGFIASGFVPTMAIAATTTAFGAATAWLLARRRTSAAVAELERVRDEHRRLQGILAISSDWIWETDADNRLRYLSEQAAVVMGIPVERLVGLRRSVLAAGPEDRLVVEEIDRAVQARREFRNREYRIILPDGRVRHMRVSGRPQFDSQGTFDGYIGVGSDVTAQAEAALRARRAESLLRSAVDSLHDGFILFDGSGRQLMCNRRFYSVMHAVGVHIRENATLQEILSQCSTNPEMVDELFSNWFRTQYHPLKIQTPAGKWLLIRHVATKDNGTFTIWADISGKMKRRAERQELEVQLRNAQKLEAVGTLAGGVAHEINTPIQYVSDNLKFLSDSFSSLQRLLKAVEPVCRDGHHRPDGSALARIWDETDVEFLIEEIPRALDESTRGTKVVADIVRALKEFSHPSAREPVNVNINDAIKTTSKVCVNEWKHDAQLILNLSDEPVDVVGVPGELNQVVLNLIVNAVHAIQDAERGMGDIMVTTAREGDYVSIVVEDTGNGVPPEIVERIFEPFFTTKSVGKGTGQGLAIVHDIVVRKHKGSITVGQREGGGARFELRLHAAPAGETAAMGVQ